MSVNVMFWWNNPKHDYCFHDNGDNSYQQLHHGSEDKDIGVLFQDNLSFSKHISIKVDKANSMPGLIKRSFQFLDATLLVTL